VGQRCARQPVSGIACVCVHACTRAKTCMLPSPHLAPSALARLQENTQEPRAGIHRAPRPPKCLAGVRGGVPGARCVARGDAGRWLAGRCGRVVRSGAVWCGVACGWNWGKVGRHMVDHGRSRGVRACSRRRCPKRPTPARPSNPYLNEPLGGLRGAGLGRMRLEEVGNVLEQLQGDAGKGQRLPRGFLQGAHGAHGLSWRRGTNTHTRAQR
jgi:hypothetical protein